MQSQEECKRRFAELCREIVTRTKAIDEITPGGKMEPKWWLDMQDIERLSRDAYRKYAENPDSKI